MREPIGKEAGRELTPWYILKGITVSCGQSRGQGQEDCKRVTVAAYGHLCEISSKDTRDIVGCEALLFPIEIFAVLSF